MYYNGYVALEFFRRTEGKPWKLGVIPAAFNPPTRAHLALACAALQSVDEVLFVLPRVFPHKSYQDARFEQRIEMLTQACAQPQFSIAASQGGLFIDIAGECHEAYGDGVRLSFICGCDAAERIIHWDYGEPGAFLRMLEQFEMLVAARGARFLPPPEMAHRIHLIEVADQITDVSASEVRRRVRLGEPWQNLVPAEIVPLVAKIYAAKR